MHFFETPSHWIKCGLRKRPLHLDNIFIEIFLCRVPTFRDYKCGNTWRTPGYLSLVLLIEMGSMVATFWFTRVMRSTAYFNVIIEVYGQIFTVLGPKQKSQGLFCWISWLSCLRPVGMLLILCVYFSKDYTDSSFQNYKKKINKKIVKTMDDGWLSLHCILGCEACELPFCIMKLYFSIMSLAPI